MRNGEHGLLDRWLREGRPEPRPTALAAHLDECESCRRALAEVDETASWFPAPGDLAPESVEAIRFRLMAETRQASRREPAPRRARALLAAAAALICVGIGGAVSFAVLAPAPSPTPEPQPQPQPRAQPEPRPKPQPQAQPEPQPQAQPEPQPQPEPAPAPQPRVASRRPADGFDARFQTAWHMQRAGRYDEAAARFDQLLATHGDGPRRSDLLYWSGRAHLLAGRVDRARARFEEILRDHPDAWHAPDARLLLERQELRRPGQ